MTSRIPPSRRDPEYAPQRSARAVAARTPGTGRVAAAAPNLSGDIAALLRGRATGSAASADPLYLEAIVVAGTASVGANVMPPGFRVPTATVLREVYVNVDTAPTGAALTLLIKRAGVTLATVTVAAGATSGSSTGLSTALAKGDMLTVDITTVGSGAPGSHVLVTIEGS